MDHLSSGLSRMEALHGDLVHAVSGRAGAVVDVDETPDLTILPVTEEGETETDMGWVDDC